MSTGAVSRRKSTPNKLSKMEDSSPSSSDTLSAEEQDIETGAAAKRRKLSKGKARKPLAVIKLAAMEDILQKTFQEPKGNKDGVQSTSQVRQDVNKSSSSIEPGFRQGGARKQLFLSSDAIPADAFVLQLKITLKNIKPPIWRRIEILNTDTFHDLQKYIIKIMGWMSTHLHHFVFKTSKSTLGDIFIKSADDYAATIHLYEFDVGKMFKEKDVKLSDFLSKVGDKIMFLYDFGDNWEHDIVVEKILPPSNCKAVYPKCLTGKRACPPEDCGGVGGYDHLLQVYKDPRHPEYNELIREWLHQVSPDFDPERFELDDIF